MLPGDTLLLYTDGVTESLDSLGEEFGEERLMEALLRSNHLPPHEMLKLDCRGNPAVRCL